MKYPNIEKERKRLGIKRKELAYLLGIKKDVYIAWVSGEYPIPANFLFALSKILCCSVDYLLGANVDNDRWRQYHLMWLDL